MAVYDELPLDKPTLVDQDSTVEVWATRTKGGGTVEYRVKAGSPTANRQTISEQVDAALVTLQTQIDAPNPTVANLAALVKLQGAIQFQAKVLRHLIRLQRDDMTGTD